MCVDEVLWALRDDYIEMFGAGVSCTLTLSQRDKTQRAARSLGRTQRSLVTKAVFPSHAALCPPSQTGKDLAWNHFYFNWANPTCCYSSLCQSNHSVHFQVGRWNGERIERDEKWFGNSASEREDNLKTALFCSHGNNSNINPKQGNTSNLNIQISTATIQKPVVFDSTCHTKPYKQLTLFSVNSWRWIQKIHYNKLSLPSVSAQHRRSQLET